MNTQTAIDLRRLMICPIPQERYHINPFTMLVFGITGDLGQKKILPALYHTFIDHLFPENGYIIGTGTRKLSLSEFREFATESIRKYSTEKPEDPLISQFLPHLFYHSMDVTQSDVYPGLIKYLDEVASTQMCNNIIYYLAVQPELTPVILQNLRSHNPCKDNQNAKVVIEKPFGEDRISAENLNRIISTAFDEKQIYRIDHYLAKDTVQNIMFFRFSNSIFEPLWNRLYIDHVQITVAEDIGIENRGRFYDKSGVVRDIIQNHLLQLLATIAMDPPSSFDADIIRNEKLKVFLAVRLMGPEAVDRYTVRGQYGSGIIGDDNAAGYREEQYVDPHSLTPTFFAGVFHIDNWRWAGVPFYVRAGKRLSTRITEISIHFKQPPLRLFGRTTELLESNVLALGIQPDEYITIRFGVKYPGQNNTIYPVTMDFNYEKAFEIRRHPPYERVLIDLMREDLTIFSRQDGIEAMWGIVDPIISRWESAPPTDFPNYRAGTWGPRAAIELIERDGRSWYIS